MNSETKIVMLLIPIAREDSGMQRQKPAQATPSGDLGCSWKVPEDVGRREQGPHGYRCANMRGVLR